MYPTHQKRGGAEFHGDWSSMMMRRWLNQACGDDAIKERGAKPFDHGAFMAGGGA